MSDRPPDATFTIRYHTGAPNSKPSRWCAALTVTATYASSCCVKTPSSEVVDRGV